MKYLLKLIVFSLLLPCIANATTRKGYIPAGKLKLYYESSGSGPAVIFLHGGYLDLHSWDSQVYALSKKYKIVCFDLPGHGQTKGTDTTLLIQDVIRIVMDSLHIDKASFVGLSLGSSCALDFALAFPERVNKLILTSPGLNGWSDVMKLDPLSEKLFAHSDSVFLGKNHQLITETFTHLWCDGPYRKAGDVSYAVRTYVYRTVYINDVQSDNTWPVFNKNKAAKRAHTIAAQVMILAGSKDMPFILSVAKFLHDNISHSTLHIIKGSAHMVNLEQPQVFNTYLKNFLSTTIN